MGLGLAGMTAGVYKYVLLFSSLTELVYGAGSGWVYRVRGERSQKAAGKNRKTFPVASPPSRGHCGPLMQNGTLSLDPEA